VQGGEVEIETFGLVPEFIGKGLGGYALTLGVQRAWNLVPGVRRIWLHTSSLDHPGALPNHQRRGFRTFKTEAGERGQFVLAGADGRWCRAACFADWGQGTGTATPPAKDVFKS
jgi:hypothetical protein